MAKKKAKNGWGSLLEFFTGSSLAEINRSDQPNVEARQQGKTERTKIKEENKTSRNEEKTEQQKQKQDAFANLHESVQGEFERAGSGILGAFGVETGATQEEQTERIRAQGEADAARLEAEAKAAAAKGQGSGEEDLVAKYGPMAGIVLFVIALIAIFGGGSKK